MNALLVATYSNSNKISQC